MTHVLNFPLAPVPDRSFTPVPVRPRHDGWTPARQAQFIEALASSGCVSAAASHVYMSKTSAYALYQHEGAAAFRAAWDAALRSAVRLLSESALSRAINGVAVPHFYKGQIVGESRRYDEGLTRFLLQHLDKRTYAPRTGATMFDMTEQHIAARADAVRALDAPVAAGAIAPPAGLLPPGGLAPEPRARLDGPSAVESAEEEVDRVWRENLADLARVRGDMSSG